MVLEKTLESPLDCKEINLVNPNGNQSWIFLGRTDAEAEAQLFWPPNGKNWLIRKDPDAGKDWRWEEKEMTEDEMVGWHHQLDGRKRANSGSWWWTGRPGILQSIRSQRVRHDWVTELNWTELMRWELPLCHLSEQFTTNTRQFYFSKSRIGKHLGKLKSETSSDPGLKFT